MFFTAFVLRILRLFISNFTIEYFPSFSEKRTTKCQTKSRQNTLQSQSEPRYRVCGFTISIWCWARVLLDSGRLITNTANCPTLEWVGDTFASSNNKAVFTLPRV